MQCTLHLILTCQTAFINVATCLPYVDEKRMTPVGDLFLIEVNTVSFLQCFDAV